jgi:hypothetical protein
VWAAISVFQTPRYLLLHKQGTTWSFDLVGLGEDDNIYGSAVWGFGSTVFAVMVSEKPENQSYSTDVNVYRKVGNDSWTKMILPSHSLGTVVTRIWGRNENDVFMVGSQYDQTVPPLELHQPVKAVLYHFDGCAWNDFTPSLPSDATQLTGISGTGGKVVVVGTSHVSPNTVGLTLVSSDLINWTRFDSQQAVGYGDVWMPRPGSILAGGNYGDPDAGSAFPGYARLATSSLNVWAESVIDPSAEAVNRIFSVPGSDQVLLITSNVGVYSGHCQ